MRQVLWSSALLLGISGWWGFTEVNTGKTVQDFVLRSTDGKIVSLRDYPEAKGFIVVFTCNHCPFASLYPKRLNALSEKYRPLGVPLLAISSTDTIVYEEDSFEEMVKKAHEESFLFPYLFDGDQSVAKQFGAQKTPHAFVIWKEGADWVIRYSGAIDDNGAVPDKVMHPYAAEAVDALLHGEKVQVEETSSIGCSIHFRGKR